MPNRDYTIRVRVTEDEKKMVEALCKKFGQVPKSDMIRRCIHDRFTKMFPVYITDKKIKPIEEAITDEQYCEMFGGKVGKNSDGNLVCIKGTWSVPLDRRDLIKDRFSNL